jgi:cellulose synthase/poly-beta-1,6-N-acetylglucosamine synthase-like glycosyltransferase
MSVIALVLVFLTFSISVFNFITIRKPENDDLVSESVTVIVPMRNESENVAECISALAGQSGVAELKVILVNDSSTDDTQALIQRAIAGDSRFTVIDSPELRTGWLGKVSALQAGYEAAHSEFIVTIDADVRLKPKALARAINQLKDLELDFVSPYPQQVAVSFAEKLIQPLLHWSWMNTVVLRLAEKYPMRSTAIANGQFFVVRKEALDLIEGFSSVSDKILDDIEIARSLIANGFKGIVTEGSGIAKTRMYSSFTELRSGYGKSLWKAFGGRLGSLIAIFFIFAVGILPFVLFLNGYLIGFILFLLSVLTRELSALRSRSNPIYAFLHPLSSALLIYLIIYSWSKRGKIQWKGRTV